MNGEDAFGTESMNGSLESEMSFEESGMLGELESEDGFEGGLEGFEEADGEGAYDLEGDLEDLDGEEMAGELDFEADFEPISEEGAFGLGEEVDFELEEFGESDPEGFFKKIGGFFRKAARGLGKVVRAGARALGKIVGPLFKKLAPIAARIVGGAIGGPAGAAIGGQIASAVLRESEVEAAGETEIELAQGEEEFVESGGEIEAYEAMEFYAAEAAEAEEERRADTALIRMARMATRSFRRNPKLRAVVPRVLRGALALAKSFRANRRTRWAVKAIPLIVVRTLTRLARVRRVTPKAVVIAMSRETAWVLANRRRAVAVLKRHTQARRRHRGHRSRRRRRLRRESDGFEMAW